MEDGAVRPKEEKNNKWLIVIFGVLVLAIIALVVCIILFPKKKEEVVRELTVEEQNYYTEVGNEVDLLNEIKDYIGGADESEAVKYLNGKIEEHKDDGMKAKIELVKVNYLSSINKNEDALRLLDEILNEGASPKDEIELYFTYSQIYNKIGDNEKYQEYRSKYMEKYLDYYDGGGGIE